MGLKHTVVNPRFGQGADGWVTMTCGDRRDFWPATLEIQLEHKVASGKEYLAQASSTTPARLCEVRRELLDELERLPPACRRRLNFRTIAYAGDIVNHRYAPTACAYSQGVLFVEADASREKLIRDFRSAITFSVWATTVSSFSERAAKYFSTDSWTEAEMNLLALGRCESAPLTALPISPEERKAVSLSSCVVWGEGAARTFLRREGQRESTLLLSEFMDDFCPELMVGDGSVP